VWFAAVFLPMVASQLLRLSQKDPAFWLACDYGGRLLALAVLAVHPQARRIAFRRENLTAPLGLVAAWMAGLIFVEVSLLPYLGHAIDRLIPGSKIGLYPETTGILHLVDAVFGLALVAFHEEIVFRRCARAFFGEGDGLVVKSALLFALYHWWTGLGNMAEAGVFGILAMLAYRRCGGLWPVVVAHYLIDAITFF
jgi:membrane protease YdiL (CAAX protease family)